jgi:predicted PurR-regulated permease PerM
MVAQPAEGGALMPISREAAFWIGGALLLVALLWLLGDVLLPFVLGIALAYLLDPVADRLERLGLSRTLATTTILATFFAAIAIGLLLLYPVLAEQISGLVRRLPELADQARYRLLPYINSLLQRVGVSSPEKVQEAASGQADKAVQLAVGFLGGVITSGAAIINALSVIVVTPVVAFYMIRDWDRLTQLIDDWLPRKHYDVLREQLREIDRVLSGFVRGQLTVCVILGAFYAVGLTVIGLEFGLVIGLLSGLLSIIPYVGTLLGFVATAGIATIQFWNEPWWIAAALGIFALGQFLEGNVITPKLVGDKVGLHPVWLMFALLAFGSLFGFLGVLLAVPAAAVIGVLVRFGLGHYRTSAFYLGEDP